MKHCFLLEVIVAIVVSAASAQIVAAQKIASSPGTPVRMVVTVEARHGTDVPGINREDVMVHEGATALR